MIRHLDGGLGGSRFGRNGIAERTGAVDRAGIRPFRDSNSIGTARQMILALAAKVPACPTWYSHLPDRGGSMCRLRLNAYSYLSMDNALIHGPSANSLLSAMRPRSDG